MMHTSYPIARYRFTFAVETPIRLPDYAGSMLRGAFGHALRRTACMTREKDCKACPLYRSCPYPAIFETPAPASHALQRFSQIPNPYVIEPPAWGSRTYQPGDTLEFHLVLMGPALHHLALTVYAWQRAFQHGIGRGTAHLADIAYCPAQQPAQSIWQGQQLQPHQPQLQLPAAGNHGLVLQFHTPLRLQNNGKPLRPHELTTRELLVATMRRMSLMLEFHAGQAPQHDFAALAAQVAGLSSQHQLQWQDWTRYSCRQQQEMQLGGVLGRWQLPPLPAPFPDWLALGQWLHLGKNASFGLGGYTLQLDTRAG